MLRILPLSRAKKVGRKKKMQKSQSGDAFCYRVVLQFSIIASSSSTAVAAVQVSDEGGYILVSYYYFILNKEAIAAAAMKLSSTLESEASVAVSC